MPDLLRVGFVGCGRHSGMRIYPALKPAGLELVAICDADEQKAKQRAAEYNCNRIYTDVDAMCRAENLDAILIVTGPAGHYEVGNQLLNKGYHLWTEKPCAVTAEQAQELASLAATQRRHFQVGFNYRYALGVQKAVELMQSGRFGTPAMTSVRWWLGEPDTVRFMQHYACHAVDLLHYLTPGGLVDQSPSNVEYARRDNFDWYLLTFRGRQGGISVLELGAHMGGQCHHSRIDLMSGDGVLTVRDFTELTHYNTAPWGSLAKPDSKTYDGDQVWRTEPLLNRGWLWMTYGYAEELRRFREAVQGLRAPEATVAEAAWGMQVMDQLVHVAEKNSPVPSAMAGR